MTKMISKTKTTKAKAAHTPIAEPKARPVSAVTRARLILCDKPAATNADLARRLRAKGTSCRPRLWQRFVRTSWPLCVRCNRRNRQSDDDNLGRAEPDKVDFYVVSLRGGLY